MSFCFTFADVGVFFLVARIYLSRVFYERCIPTSGVIIVLYCVIIVPGRLQDFFRGSNRNWLLHLARL